MAWKQVKDTQELLRVFMIMFKQFSYAYVCFQNIKRYLAILNTMFWNRFNNTFYFLFLMHHYFAKRSLYLKNFLWQFDFHIFCVAMIPITITYHFSSIDSSIQLYLIMSPIDSCEMYMKSMNIQNIAFWMLIVL